MAAVPLCASLVPAMVAGPTVAPLTSPLPLTEATAVLLDAQVTVRPVSVLPFASLRVAVSWNVRPVGTEAEAGVTVTEATGAGGGAGVTVIAAVPLLPSLVAVIVAEPAATPVTRPLLLTVATAVLLLDQVMTRPVSVLPAESLVTAESCRVAPTATLADAGFTVRDATGTAVTVMAAVPLLPSLVAVIVAEPTALLVTLPLALTVATAKSLVVHVTGRPASGPPAESRATAVSCTAEPTRMVAEVGETVTDATGTGLTVTI